MKLGNPCYTYVCTCTSPVYMISIHRQLKHGVTELGVHIADVSHFVRPDSLTDREACLRSTSVYLADRRCDMLPRILNADLCSLLSERDRSALCLTCTCIYTYYTVQVFCFVCVKNCLIHIYMYVQMYVHVHVGSTKQIKCMKTPKF